jgi:hypothetical protein
MPPIARNRIGQPPIYGKRMRLWKCYLSDDHRAMLTLAAARTGKSRAALVREGIEHVTDEIFSAPSTSKAALPSAAAPYEGKDDVPVKPSI